MKNFLLIMIILTGVFVGGCAQSEPAADTSGVMHKDDAPPTDGEVNGGGQPAANTSKTDATESSSEGG